MPPPAERFDGRPAAVDGGEMSPRTTRSSRSDVPGDVGDGFGKGLRGFLRQVSPEAAPDDTDESPQPWISRHWIATQPPVDVAKFAARLRGAMDGGDLFWVLVDGERVVGTLGLHGTPAAGVGALGTSIVAGSRGAGGGRLLMDALMEHVRLEARLHKVELEVWPDNGRAIALYASYGFEVEGLRREHYRRKDGSLRSSLLMALLLKG